MRFILKALSSYLLRHPGQLGLAVIGMAVGIAVIVAVDIANESARRSFETSLTAVTGTATHQIIGGPTGIDEKLYVNLRLNGMRNIAPIVEGIVRIEGETFQLLGIDLFAERNFRTYPSDGGNNDGNGFATGIAGLLTKPGGVLMMGGAASRLGIKSGDKFTVKAAGNDYQAELVSIMGKAQGLERMLIADISVAQQWLGLIGRLTRIDVRTENGITHELEQMLTGDAKLINAAGRNNSILEMSAGFNTSLMAMSLFALLVGVFLIYNCMSFMVLQRRPIIGVLRALGVTRGQIVSALLIEGMIIATVGVIIGVICGAFLGEQLVTLVSRGLTDHYYVVRETTVTLSNFSILKGIAAGIIATLIAVSVPALEAVSYPPRLTLVRSVVEENARNLLLWFALTAGALIIGAGVVLTFSDVSLIAGFFCTISNYRQLSIAKPVSC